MTHEEARDLLTDRLLDELSESDRARLEEHLERCAECRRAAGEWQAAWEALGSLRPAPLDGAAQVRFGRRLEQELSMDRPFIPLGRPLLGAAAVVLLLVGGLTGRALAPAVRPVPGDPPSTAALSSADDRPRFLLLLRGEEPDRRQPADVLVREYGEWAASLAEAGSLIAAAELEAGTARWVAPDVEPDPVSTGISGFFLVAASSYDSAVAIARGSPHVAYGGVVEVRRLVDGR